MDQWDETESPAQSAAETLLAETALLAPAGEAAGRVGGAGDAPGDAPYEPRRTWRHELPRWLATLNPGRTRIEYERAIRYFFDTPGVPEVLTDLTFDLLLAYRGALALRAAPRGRSDRSGFEQPAARLSRLSGATPEALPGDPGSDAPQAKSPNRPASGGTAPLAPATVNVRLTALRQFLVHCAFLGELPILTPDRIRGALRRLSIERRRPYQVLAEAEWAEFLRAALLPAIATPRPSSSASRDNEQVEAGPGLVKSRAGLTGARTAQRDHALLSLALATGLRAIELSQLDVGDLAREWHGGQEEWWLVLPDAKTKGQRGGRTLPLGPELVDVLLSYIKETGRRWEDMPDRTTPLFLSRRLEPRYQEVSHSADPILQRRLRRLSPAYIRGIVDRVESQWLASRNAQPSEAAEGRKAGETRAISPHALRHSTAIALLEGNTAAGRPPASVEHVRGWLGHFDIRTTQGYLAHLDARRHRRPLTITPASGTSAAAADLPVERPAAEPEGSAPEGSAPEE